MGMCVVVLCLVAVLNAGAEVRVLELDECVEVALERNRRRTVSRLGVELAEAQLQQALSVRWPQVAATSALTLRDEALIDLGLMGMPGDEVARRLREIDFALGTVLITGWKLEEDDPRLEAFDIYLRKPFGQLQRVQEAVQQAVDLYLQRVEH